MPEDLLILVDEMDREQGRMGKQEAHEKAALHRAFSVFLHHDGKLLLQRRAKAKYHCGGLWANSCCSHPRAGETLEEAVPRRLAQELGITVPVAVQELFGFVYRAPFSNGLTEHEFDHVFIGQYDGPLHPDQNEIDEVRWVSFEQLRRELAENPQQYGPWFLACAPKVLAILLGEEPLPDASRSAGESLAWRYPQFTLEVRADAGDSEEYKDIVRRGHLPHAVASPFAGEVRLVHFATPAGLAELAWLPNRPDFERFVQVMCHRCEPVPVPASMGAVSVFGANSWRRVLHHRARYEAAGHSDWPSEFKRFTQDKAHYQDTLLAVTDGPYSGLPAAESGYEAAQWPPVSLRIRIYHELAHYISRRLYSQNRQTVRDEVLADCIGLLAASGSYEPLLAKRLLGVENHTCRPGGRLENYLADDDAPDDIAQRAGALVDAFATFWHQAGADSPFAFLQKAEVSGVGLDIMAEGNRP